MNNNKLLKDVLKPLASLDAIALISYLYEHEEVKYDGIDFMLNGKNVNNRVQKLIQNKIIDYDRFTETLSLEYQSDVFFRYLMENNTETNIEEVQKKIKLIETNINNIAKRKKSFESYDKEVKIIQKALRSVSNIIEKNITVLNNGALFAYKVEKNYDIKIDFLKVCQTETDKLAKALEKFSKFINNRNNNKVFIEILSNILLLDSIRQNLMKQRKSILKTREYIIQYIAKTIEDGKFLKKLNLLSSIIKNGKIFADTNLVEVIHNKPLLPEKIEEKKKLDFDIGDFQDELEKKYIELNAPKIKEEKKVYKPVNIEKVKEVKTVKIIKPYEIYKKFLQNSDDTDLATYIFNIVKERKKVSFFISLIVLKWHTNLNITNQKIKIENFEYPIITK